MKFTRNKKLFTKKDLLVEVTYLNFFFISSLNSTRVYCDERLGLGE